MIGAFTQLTTCTTTGVAWVEMNKLAAKEYDELNSTFLQISNVKKVPPPPFES